MNLLIDIGNSNLRWTCHGQDCAWDMAVVRHSGGVPLDLLAQWEQLEPPERLVVSNVGGQEVADALERVTRALWRRAPEYLRTEAVFGGVRIAYEEPLRLGVDRWLALIAAHELCQQACLIVDAGTAATFDLLLADGRHLGGLILPGVEMMRKSLLMGTRIPRIEADPAGEPWATDTAPAVAAGSLQGLASLATRLFDRLAAEAGQSPRLILTGGDAERIQPALDRPAQLVQDLVLRGMRCVVDAGA
ncbi:type III pantothenate kinase [Thiorhodococcus mannitoliphagus]|uniref:Type III pantothenate kinase n=1 Tax=Thiorhodococcus mannitoliphagus TaxID=329406 RepID=A0A6P1DT69_9GAMM|nr:type III pantothenate kinase [Thiorhodococcus mannitoliphagus]NEX18905.1 type III pantothenate kinase [Thiorhodococcus mannitoliphagus]